MERKSKQAFWKLRKLSVGSQAVVVVDDNEEHNVAELLLTESIIRLHPSLIVQPPRK